MSAKNKQNSLVNFVVRAIFMIHPRRLKRLNNAIHYKHPDIIVDA